MLNTDKAVIRNDIGHLVLHQCKPKLSTEQAISAHIQAKNNKTVGDILNRLKYNNSLRQITRG